MKKIILGCLVMLPLISFSQDERGRMAIGTQFYQNILQPDNHQGFGVGVNWQLDIAKGFGIDANYFFENADLLNAGNIKRFQRGVAFNYVPLYKKALSPWIQVGMSFNTITVTPVSYLFNVKSEEVIEQSYFGLNLGIGGRYNVNDRLTVNTGFYFQPQNYTQNYNLVVSDEKAILETNVIPAELDLEPLLYFNLGITYKIAKLW